jgi:diguanylate cyclase
MDAWAIGLPATVALAAVVALGYMYLRLSRHPNAERLSARRELKRAKSIIRDLERIAELVRSDVADHQRALQTFDAQVDALSSDLTNDAGWHELAEEAERLLKPTQRLATQIAHAYDELRQQTNLLMSFTEVRTDPLTGLTNRRALDETLLNHLAMNARYGSPFSIALFDIDYFKQVNDQHGHLAGDRVLQQMALVLDQYVRETDIVSRFGGEEFVVVLPNTDLAGACTFAERMRTVISKAASLTISCGVATAEDGDDSQRLLTRADTALYTAKSSGRNIVFQHTGDAVLPVAKSDDGLGDGDRPCRPTWRASDLPAMDGEPLAPRPSASAAAPIAPVSPLPIGPNSVVG